MRKTIVTEPLHTKPPRTPGTIFSGNPPSTEYHPYPEAAALYPFEETRKALYEGARKAISAIPKCKPYVIQTPIKAKMEYLDLNPALPQPKLITKEWTRETAIQLLDR